MQRRFPTSSASVKAPLRDAPCLTPFSFTGPGHLMPPNTEMLMKTTQASETSAPPPAMRYILVRGEPPPRAAAGTGSDDVSTRGAYAGCVGKVLRGPPPPSA